MEITSFSGFLGKNFSKTVTAFLANYIRYAIINTYSYLDIVYRIRKDDDRDAAAREHFSHVLAMAAEDEVYQKLLLHCEFLDEPVLAALEKLPETDRSVIRAYIHLMGASALRLTEVACEQ